MKKLLAVLLVAFGLCLPTGAVAHEGHADQPPRIVALTPFAANTLARLGVMPVGT